MTVAIVGILLAGLLLLGLLEAALHRGKLGKIRYRIHVNGTRGKSSVVRLIAGGLRAGGFVTCAKTTGTAPRMILPDGSEYAVYRPARPNIIEQVRVVDAASDLGAQVLVMECMALQPLLQSLCELRLVRATHGVITNVRADHLDVMGPQEEDVALALAGSIPMRGILFTASERCIDILESAARDRGSQMVVVTPTDVAEVTTEEMRGFGYLEQKANVALALRVCAALGVDRDVALRGMWESSPDPGVLSIHEVEFFGRRIFFANGFAANDPESTEQVWRQVLSEVPAVERRIALFNCRVDRPDRSRQLGEACVRWPKADSYVLMGTGTYIFARAATQNGLDPRNLVIVEEATAAEVFETLLEQIKKSGLVMGMGNIHGGGEELVRLFRNRGSQRELRAWS